eukprot:14320255-Alexandrium_andersonii.AAC.1
MPNRDGDHALGLHERRVEAKQQHAARAAPLPPISIAAAEDICEAPWPWTSTLRSGLPLGRPGRPWR